MHEFSETLFNVISYTEWTTSDNDDKRTTSTEIARISQTKLLGYFIFCALHNFSTFQHLYTHQRTEFDMPSQIGYLHILQFCIEHTFTHSLSNSNHIQQWQCHLNMVILLTNWRISTNREKDMLWRVIVHSILVHHIKWHKMSNFWLKHALLRVIVRTALHFLAKIQDPVTRI